MKLTKLMVIPLVLVLTACNSPTPTTADAKIIGDKPIQINYLNETGKAKSYYYQVCVDGVVYLATHSGHYNFVIGGAKIDKDTLQPKRC